MVKEYLEGKLPLTRNLVLEVREPGSGDSLQDWNKKVDNALRMSASWQAGMIAKAARQLKRVLVTSVGFERNPNVVAQVLLDALGICAGCGEKAPFLRRSDGSPYVKVHHGKRLSDGGEDNYRKF